jgi:RNA polymerase sigma-70 factor (ECF subfamily)
MATGYSSATLAARDPDIRLMLRVRAGDDAAFAELVTRYQHRLLAVLHHHTGTLTDAEDLVQEVFLRVHRNRAGYKPQAKFSTWLFAIAHNLALNARRDRKRRPVVPLELPADTSNPGTVAGIANEREPSPTAPLQQAELAAAVQAALEQLSERQRMAVVLNKYEDMGYAEIAQVLDLTPQAVKSLLSRAREKLREALEPYVRGDHLPPHPETLSPGGTR